MVIRDGDRIVGAVDRPGVTFWRPRSKEDPAAYLDPEQFPCGQSAIHEGGVLIGAIRHTSLTLFVPHPGEDVTKLITPQRWNHMDPFGFQLSSYGGVESEPKVTSTGKTMILEWSGRARNSVHTTRRVVLSVDPVLGYVVHNTMVWKGPETEIKELTKPTLDKQGRPRSPEQLVIAGVRPCGEEWMLPEWQERNYSWMFYTPDATLDPGEGKPFQLARLNLVAFDSVRGRHIRRGGLTGYIGHHGGWGIVMTVPQSRTPIRSDVDCEYWDYALRVSYPDQPDASGICQATIQWRFSGMPPEMCSYVRDNASVRGHDKRNFQVRFEEDFEGQPLPITQPDNSIRYLWPEHNPRISTTESHSGKNSIEVAGTEKLTSTPKHGNRSEYRLFPNRRYRLSCWVKVVGADTQAFVAHHHSGILPSEGSEPIGRYRTGSVLAGEWQKVTYDFTAAPNGEPITFGFVCLGPGTAYFDDFRLVQVKEDKSP